MTDKTDITNHPDGMTTTIIELDPEREKRAGGAELGIEHRRASEIEMIPIRWLWPNRFAFGKVSILAGHPKLGKSQVTASIAAVATTGGKFPVDRTDCPRVGVAILSAEDDPADTIVPRLALAGADRDQVHILGMIQETDDRGGKRRRQFSLEQDLAKLDALLDEVGDIGLIVIDPLTAYLGRIDSHKMSDVRAVLGPLSEFANRTGVAVLCVTHLNKAGGSGEAMMRVIGSGGFVAAARSIYLVMKDADDPKRRLFLPAGGNNTPDDVQGLAYQVRGGEPKPGIVSACVVWEPEPVQVTADDAMVAASGGGKVTSLDEAKEFLLDLLGEGRVRSKDVWATAEREGHKKRTLDRAKEKLGVKSTRDQFGGKPYWELPDPHRLPKNHIHRHVPNVAIYGKSGNLWELVNEVAASKTSTPAPFLTL